MPQRPRRTDATRVARVPTPHLSLQLAEAAAAVTEAAVLPRTDHANSRQPGDDGNGSGCHELPHETELQVRRHLLGQSELTFSSLIVRRMNNGVCLQGVVESSDDHPDFARLVREVAAVERVISQLVVRPRRGDTASE
jgi:osmotically-inducible protein OsmY